MQVALTLLEIDRLQPYLEPMTALLSQDERARAERFHFARDRSRFILGRAALRQVLAARTGEAPERLRFIYGDRGKPSLAESGLAFNASGSQGLVAVAVAERGALGVDVERPRPNADWPAIARRFFAPLEQEELFALPEAHQEEGFLRLWTLKEAVIKFTGRGLGQGLESFAVSLADGSGPRVADWSSAFSRPDALWTKALESGAQVSLACGAPELDVVAGALVGPLLEAAVDW